MKKFDTLYKRTKTGAIQFWKVEVIQDSPTIYPLIRKTSGQIGTTSPIVYEENITEGKQKRSDLEQALAQAESDWKRKKDEGYKSLDDLGGVQMRITDSGFEWKHNEVIYTAEVDLLNSILPTTNTDASGNVKPMLATDWKKIAKIEYPCYIEPKLDGVRCLMIVNPTTIEPIVRFLSRSGKDYITLGHIADDVIKYLANEVYRSNSDVSFILDGEIYSNELTFQEIVQATKKQCLNSLKLQFRAYDIVNDQSQENRRNALKPLVKSIDSEFIQHITWFVATDSEDVKKMHDQFVQQGNEGAMLRMFEGKYSQGQRSRELLKVKEFDETEHHILRLEYGQRGVEDLLAVCKINGKEFKAKIQGTKAQKIEFEASYKSKHEAGRTVDLTIKHFGFTTDGIPRFPVGKALRDYE